MNSYFAMIIDFMVVSVLFGISIAQQSYIQNGYQQPPFYAGGYQSPSAQLQSQVVDSSLFPSSVHSNNQYSLPLLQQQQSFQQQQVYAQQPQYQQSNIKTPSVPKANNWIPPVQQVQPQPPVKDNSYRPPPLPLPIPPPSPPPQAPKANYWIPPVQQVQPQLPVKDNTYRQPPLPAPALEQYYIPPPITFPPIVKESNYYVAKPAYPLPSCYKNRSGFMCCNRNLEKVMLDTYTNLEDMEHFSSCNVHRIAVKLQERTEARFNVSFETIVGQGDYASKTHFSGDLVCKVEKGGRFMLAYATPVNTAAANDGDKDIYGPQPKSVHTWTW